MNYKYRPKRMVIDMDAFNRRNGSRHPVKPNDKGLGHLGMAIELVDAFAEHDATSLAALDAAGRAAQLRARQSLYNYVDRIWHGAKAHGLEPANRPQWSVVAGLRDLTNALLEQAVTAQLNAGDENAR